MSRRPDAGGRTERGQVMLVGAVAVAVVLLGLVAVLNAGVYTENVSRQGALASADAADAATAAVRADTGRLMGAVAERQTNGTTYLLPARLDANVTTYSRYAGLAVATDRPAAVDVSLNRTHTGRGGLLVQRDADRRFAPADGADRNWTLARGVTRLTVGELTVHSFPVHDPSGNATFRLSAADDDGDRWLLELHWNGTDDRAHVRTLTDAGPATACSFGQSDRNSTAGVTVNLTAGTVSGTDCEFSYAAGVDDPYRLSYGHTGSGGTAARGTYELGVDGNVEASNVDADPGVTAPVDPYLVPNVTAATVDVAYRSPRLGFETTLVVEPRVVPRSTLAPGTGPFGAGVVYVLPGAEGRLARVPDVNGTTTAYGVTGVTAVAPAAVSLDGDRSIEAPFANSSGGLALVDSANRTTHLLDDGAVAADSGLVVGRWEGSDPSVFYADGADEIRRVAPGTPPEQTFADAANGATSPVGIGTLDGDVGAEFVYLDGSGELRYVDDDGTVGEAMGGVTPGDAADAGPAVGPPADFDGDGSARVPVVDPWGDLYLVSEAGDRERVVVDVDVAPVATRDVDGDGVPELVYLEGGTLHYADDVATPTQSTAEFPADDGATAAEGTGVA